MLSDLQTRAAVAAVDHCPAQQGTAEGQGAPGAPGAPPLPCVWDGWVQGRIVGCWSGIEFMKLIRPIFTLVTNFRNI
jgi:hypothetical protein